MVIGNNSKKRILFVTPFNPNIQNLPLGIASIRANADPAYDYYFIDCVLDKFDDKRKFQLRYEGLRPDLVAISCKTIDHKELLNMVRAIREMDHQVCVLAGGAHPTCHAEYLMANCPSLDFIIRGEGEQVFNQFTDRYFRGEKDFRNIDGVVFREQGKVILCNFSNVANLDDLRIPDYDFIDLNRYIRSGYGYATTVRQNAPVFTSRGCPYNCSFCAVPIACGRKLRYHSVQYMMEWIKTLYHKHGIRFINIVDDNFTFDVQYAKEFCREVIKFGKPDLFFGTPNGVRMERGDTELWGLMKSAGWRMVTIAPESGSKAILEKMNKKLDLAKVPGIVDDMKKAGLKVAAFIIVGYPGETRKDLQETQRLIRTSGVDFAMISHFMPMPGTRVFNELVSSGEIEQGIAHHDFNLGRHPYTSKEMKTFNYNWFILKNYLFLLLKRPWNVFFLVKEQNLRSIVIKVVSVCMRSIRLVFTRK